MAGILNTPNVQPTLRTQTCTCVARRVFENALPFQEPHLLGTLMYIRGISSQLSITASFSLQVQGQRREITVEKMVRGYFRCIELSCYYNTSDTNWGVQPSNSILSLTTQSQHRAHRLRESITQGCTLQMSTANGVPITLLRLERFASTARTLKKHFTY